MTSALVTSGGRRLRLIGALGLYAAIGGAVSLLGWALDVPRLADWGNDGIAIQPNAAVAAFTAGMALLWLRHGFARVAALAGVFVAAIGATVIFQYLASIDLGIDQLLRFDRGWGDFGVLSPGRMGPTGATCWTLLGAALVLRGSGPSRHGAVAALGTIVLAASSFSLLGYLFGAAALYSVPWLSVIALQTSTMIAAVSVGVIASLPEHQPMRGVLEDSAAGVLVRRALPFILLLPILLGVLRLAGQRAGLYDTPTGVALLVLGLSSLLCAVLWWGAAAVREHELRFARDAEVRAQAELVLREVNDQFLMLDADWRYVAVNDEVCRRTGFARDALIGQNVWKLYPELIGTEYERLAQRVHDTRAPEVFEHFYRPWERWLQNRVYPAPGGGIAVFIEDITERKQAEIALQQSEERYRKLVSVVTDVPWSTDPHGAFTTPQGAWAAYTGQSWEELRDFGWADAIHPESRERVRQLWKEACERGDSYESTGLIWHAPTRSYRHFIARAVPLRNDDGSVREWVGTCTDVDEAQRREEALSALARERAELLESAQRARAEAEAANRTKDEFLAVVSHELRSPLNAMLGWIGILRSSGNDAAIVSRAHETLERNIHAQARLVDDLLDISRITAGKLELERARVGLAGVVADSVEALRSSARAKQLALTCEVPARELAVDGDEARLHQLVSNVVHNAIKFTPPGGRIAVSLRERGGQAEIEVQDSGEGIAPALLPHVFERFVQFESSTRRRHGGLGLGLAIVKQLALAHGGIVRAESEGAGKGARFTIVLPLAEAVPAASAPRPSARASDAAVSVDVIFVEDDRDSREAHTLGCAQAGLRVRAVESAGEALAEYTRRAPDVLVSDVGLSGSDGYDLIRAIRARERDGDRRTLALAVTGFASREDREAALAAGFDDHLAKPLPVQSLVARIRELAARAQNH